MYDLGPAFEHATVDPGTNILVSGPPLSGKRDVALNVLAAGARAGQGSIAVTMRDDAARVLEDFRSLLEDPGAAQVGVVDCVTQHQGRPTVESPTVTYTSSPVDLTGIGIAFSEFLEQFYADQGLERNRVALDSLTTLLMYTDLRTVFRFLHVFTGRVESADALGLYLIESGVHDAKTTSTLMQLFDGVIETAHDGAPTFVRSTGDAGANS